MNVINYPDINGGNERLQLEQIRNYLFELADRLNYTLSSVSGRSNAAVPANRSSENERADAEKTFDSLKTLIIKSSDIVSAYTDEITRRLSGEYVAKSEFGQYAESTELLINEKADGITESFRQIQTVVNELRSVLETNAYIKTGELEDGVYGVEIGQTDSFDGETVYSRFARFTSDRLSFYDQNGSEIAYISDYVLHIEHADIRASLRLGSYLVDTSDGMAFMWAGR